MQLKIITNSLVRQIEKLLKLCLYNLVTIGSIYEQVIDFGYIRYRLVTLNKNVYKY